jgi:uncharacterized membrane protein YkvA (DUF1232 family)
MKKQGKKVSKTDVDGAVAFFKQYVEYTPALLEATAAAARQVGISQNVVPILDVIEQYILNPHDMVPDHHGLAGLLDDAYVTLSLIQAISDNYRQMTGSPLVPVDMSEANSTVRVLLGDYVANQLDAQMSMLLQMQTVQQRLQQVVGYGATLPMDCYSSYIDPSAIDTQVEVLKAQYGI